MKLTPALICASLPLLIAGCGRSAAPMAVPPLAPAGAMPLSMQSAASSIPAAVVIKVPASAANALSASVTVSSGTPAVQNLAATAPGCTPASGSTPLTCSVAMTVPAAADVVTIRTYSGAGATGSVLATASFVKTFSATANSVSTILGGTPYAIALTLSRTQPQECNPATKIPLYATVSDSAGNVIVGPYASAVSLSDSDTSGDTVLSQAALPSSTGALTLSYNGYPLPQAQIGAAASGVTSSHVHGAILKPMEMIYEAANPIKAWPANSNGLVTPTREIYMPVTIQYAPAAVALSRQCMIYELDATDILAWPAKTNGRVTPSIDLSGSATRVSTQARQIALGPDGTLYVSNIGYTAGNFTPEIDVFAPGATGNIAPKAVISGSNTGLQQPLALGLDGAGNIYVADGIANAILVFAPGSNGDVAPIRKIAGTSVVLNGPDSMAVDATGKIYLENYYKNAVDVYPANANGNVAPVQSFTVASPNGVALSEHGTVVVSTPTVPAIYTFPDTASGNATPLTTLQYDTPAGITI